MKTILLLIKEKRNILLLTAALAVIGAVLSIIPFALIYQIIKMFITNPTNIAHSSVAYLLGIGLLAIVAKYIFVISSFVFSHIAAFDLLYTIRTKLTKHLGKLPMGYWAKNNSGKITKILHEDVERIENFVAHHFPDTVSGTVLPIATITFLFFINWQMALATLIPLPLGFLCIKLMYSGIASGGKNRKTLWEQYHKAIEKMNSTIVEFVQGMPIIKAFNITAFSFSRLKNSILHYQDYTVKLSKTQTPFYSAFTAMSLGGGLFIIPVGIYLLKTGQTNVPTFFMFLILGVGCFHQFVKVAMIMGHCELIFAAGRRIGDILNEQPLTEPQIAEIPFNNSVQLKNVSFKYDAFSNLALSNINITIPENSFTAIVGPSGSGKSTIVNLIARMWDIESGEILVGNKNIKNIGSVNLNSTIGTVFQDVRILTDTVINNIKMNSVNATKKQVIDAAKMANCHEFIESLPNGYDTVIGDGGDVHLSGGEKQRLSLARIALKNPKIILLDEASCYADAENEVKIQKAFSKIMAHKTVIVIAHRLSTIVKADNIIVVEDGKIAEQGNHTQLLKLNGKYTKMWNMHTKASNWNLLNGEAL